MKKLFLVALLLVGCKAQQSQIMSAEGKVILIRGCEVCVSYDMVNMSEKDSVRKENGVDAYTPPLSDKSLGCFAHLNGHRYQVGDTYPDPAKHTTGQPVDCEQSADWNPVPVKSLISLGGGRKYGAQKELRRINRRYRKGRVSFHVQPLIGELA